MHISHSLALRLLVGIGTTAFVTGIGLFASSRPAHTAGGPIPVIIANTIHNRDTDNPAQQPFGIRLYPSVDSFATFTVPVGKRMVIQQIGAFAFGSTTVQDVAISTTVSGNGTAELIPFTVNNHGISYATQSLTDYADPGTTVYVGIDDTDSNDTAGMNVDIHGYYVNVP